MQVNNQQGKGVAMDNNPAYNLPFKKFLKPKCANLHLNIVQHQF